jgi:hypothetical protein
LGLRRVVIDDERKMLRQVIVGFQDSDERA